VPEGILYPVLSVGHDEVSNTIHLHKLEAIFREMCDSKDGGLDSHILVDLNGGADTSTPIFHWSSIYLKDAGSINVMHVPGEKTNGYLEPCPHLYLEPH
jgi:hypothetical protein